MNIFDSNKSISRLIIPVATSVVISLASISAQAADISEAAVQNYASAMKKAANSKNINLVSDLVADDALISLSRRGKTTSLDKSAYLKLLQSSWSKSSDYQYDISITNVVTSGSQAKANVKTIETWTQNGTKTTLTTNSRATLKSNSNNAVLLRAVSQVTIN